MAIILDDLQVDIFVEKDGEVFLDSKTVKNWVVVRPDIAKVQGLEAPRIANGNVEARVKIETGKIHTLNIGGWYLKPPK